MSELSHRIPSGLPDNYDPEQGLKSLAVSEAGEVYAQRAKDPAMLREAINQKLIEQRRFVLWHDDVMHDGKPRRGGDQKSNRRSAIRSEKLPDNAPDPDTISRWRKRLAKEVDFAKELDKAEQRCVRVCETPSHLYPRAVNSGNNEWYTPAEYIEAARDVLGSIDLDPASSDVAQETVQAERHFTPEDDGLAQEWGGRVWLNPPYAQPLISQFATKMASEWMAGHVAAAIMLTHNYTDTGWFHEIAGACTAICFTRGRIKFPDADGHVCSPTQGQAFFYFGPDMETFAARFESIGLVMGPV